MRLHRSLRIISGIVALAGLTLLGTIAYFTLHTKLAVASPAATTAVATKAPEPAQTPGFVSGKPREIRIPSLNLTLPVIDGAYDTHTREWTLTPNKTQYALPSVQPNNRAGNTLIYGHNRAAVFASLHQLAPGATAEIVTSSGTFVYTYRSTKAYDPADTSVFTTTGAPRLTLQTCSGVFFQYRQMYFFQYDHVAKS